MNRKDFQVETLSKVNLLGGSCHFSSIYPQTILLDDFLFKVIIS